MPKEIRAARLISILKYGLVFLIATMPFYAFITVFGSLIIGHYTTVRLYKETLLVLLMIISIWWILIDRRLAKDFFKDRLVKLSVVFAAMVVLWGLISYLTGHVSLKAFGYGLIVDLRIFLVFVIAYLLSLKYRFNEKKIFKLILYPALVIVGFGLLQIFVLPHDFLSHFGYSLKTIMPFETINNNSKYVRIISLMRGSNPLGTYLIIPISALSLLLFRKSKIRLKASIFLLLSLVVLLFTFSRSAWIGAFVSVCLVVFLKIPSPVVKKRLIYLAVSALILFGLSVVVFRNNHVYQNLVFHTQSNSKSASSSDAGHLSAVSSGIHQIIANPVGEGTGTAGPASVYNSKSSPRIAENFYIQIGQELGLAGLAVFLAIQIIVAIRLYKRNSDLGIIMFASFIGITVVNMFSHAWADDSLAYVWWGLAGLVV